MDNKRGFTLWFTGLSGSGKTTVSEIVEKELRRRHGKVEVLDGDIVRTNLSKGLGFSKTQDPLLDGPVPAPSGAELNRRDQLSPQDPTTIV